MMNESTKTACFIGVAAVAVACACFTYWNNIPPKTSGFELVGQPFFEKFENPKLAEFLEISALDDNAELQSFVLKKVKGLWRIPTHSDYPAEAAERLANTSTALIGLNREALVGRLQAEHALFGVLDPKNTDNNDPETTGKRLTLKDASGDILADLIIGKKIEADVTDQVSRSFDRVEGADQYYVRKADETQTYKVRLNLNLSTRFSDWIDTKLMDVNSMNISNIKIDNYQLVSNPNDPLGTSRIKQSGDQIELTRPDRMGAWSMAGLDPSKEEVKASEVSTLIQILSDLKIVGVREKFKYQDKHLIGPDLKLLRDPNLEANKELHSQVFQEMVNDLTKRGFYLQAENGDVNSLQLVAESGELSFSTDDGIVYTLDFGKAIEGDRKFIEIGTESAPATEQESAKPNDSKAPSDDASQDAAKSSVEKATPSADAEKEKSNSGKNRYVLIRVTLDPNRVGNGPPVRPTEPVKPVQPDGYTPATVDDKKPEKSDVGGVEKTGDEKASQEKDTQQEKLETDQPPKLDEAKQERDPKFIQFDLDMANYDQAKTQYEIDLSRFEKQVEQHKKDVEESQKKVSELNERFGAWYYVVSASNLDQLKLERAALIQPVSKPPEEKNANDILQELQAQPPTLPEDLKKDDGVDSAAEKGGEEKKGEDVDSVPPPTTDEKGQEKGGDAEKKDGLL